MLVAESLRQSANFAEKIMYLMMGTDLDFLALGFMIPISQRIADMFDNLS